MKKADIYIGFFCKIFYCYIFTKILPFCRKEIFMFRYKFTLEKNGDYSILCINYQNGTIFKMKQFLPKDVIEAALVCFVLNESSQLD